MKFAHKLSLAIIVLLSVALSVVGTLTVYRNFSVSIENTVQQNLEQHLLQRYSLDNYIVSLREERKSVSKKGINDYIEGIESYVESSSRWVAIYGADMEAYYTNLPAELGATITWDMLQNEQQGYYLREAGEDRYMIISSEITVSEQTLYMLNAYDVTALFTERTRQLFDTLWMDLIVLLVSAVFVVYMSSRLTKPMRRLNLASRKISSGAYDARTEVSSSDEIGELSENFNRMAEAVQARVEELNTSVQQREDFVSAFTHEVKTPMTAIIGYSDILRSQETDPTTRQRAAQFIYRESRRLESLSQKLLVLMGLSGTEAKLLPVQLNLIFADAARSVIPNLGDYEVRLKPAEDVRVLADRDLAADLLRNLLLNALKAEPKDGLVLLGWSREGSRLRISVKDTGRGIPKEELARITEPFYMVDKSRARREGGSGVGLSLSQKIADLHGSTLDFESEVGVGTTVSFTLALPE